MAQNYTTLDTYKLKTPRGKYIRISQIHDDSEGHFVVAEYLKSGSWECGTLTNTLLECWHFIGPEAELDASEFYCSRIPELEEGFEPRDYKSYRPEKHYLNDFSQGLDLEEVAER